MKLMYKKDLLKLTHEVVFHHYNGSFPEDLNIFCNSCGERDFIYQPLIGSFYSSGSNHDMGMIYMAKEDNTYEIPLDYECQSRDGIFEDDDRYYVLSKDDLKKLIDRLTVTYEKIPGESERGV